MQKIELTKKVIIELFVIAGLFLVLLFFAVSQKVTIGQKYQQVYFNGELVEENIERAHELLLKATELKSGSAAYRIGWMYERGILSENPDYEKALCNSSNALQYLPI